MSRRMNEESPVEINLSAFFYCRMSRHFLFSQISVSCFFLTK